MRTRIASRDLRCKICAKFLASGTVISAGAGPVRCVECAKAGKIINSIKPPPPPKSEPRKDVSVKTGDDKSAEKNPGLALVEINHEAREMTIRFDSVHAAITDATTEHATEAMNLAQVQNSYAYGKGRTFLNNHSYESLAESLAKPKAEILKAIAEMSASIGQDEPPVEVKRRRLRGVDFGDEINTDRFLAHDPMCWDRQQVHHKPKSVVWIGVNLITASSETEQAVRWRGAAAAALADRLTQLGYSVGIVGIYHVQGIAARMNHCHTRITIKAPDAPLDMAAVATSVADIGFARIVGMYGSARHVPSRLTGGLGHVSTVPVRFRDGIDYLVDSDIRSRQAAADWLASSTRMSAEAEALATN